MLVYKYNVILRKLLLQFVCYTINFVIIGIGQWCWLVMTLGHTRTICCFVSQEVSDLLMIHFQHRASQRVTPKCNVLAGLIMGKE